MSESRGVPTPKNHERICQALLVIGGSFGGEVDLALRAALSNGNPIGGGPEATMKYYGENLLAVQHLTQGVVSAIEQTVPGFVAWLQATRFGDDLLMVNALLHIANRLAAMPKPAGARERPSSLKLPQFH